MARAAESSLTLEAIENVEDLFEAIDICDEHGVDVESIETMEDFKERLKLHYDIHVKGETSHRNKVANAMIETNDADRIKRNRLTHIVRKLVDIFEADKSLFDMVEEFLKQDGTRSSFRSDCERMVKDLDHGDCVVLVAGEVAAGKTSFLNLLLKSPDLLPPSHVYVPPLITIRYGQKKIAHFIYDDPGEPEIIDLETEVGISRRNTVYRESMKGENGGKIKELQVFAPVDFLKTGLVLTSIPYIDEHTVLDSCLRQYISHIQILGFIYIIRSDTPFVINEERLLHLLQLIEEEQKKDSGIVTFDPKASLFVCNRFDAIPELERLKVKEHILNQLDKHWPEFEPEMAVFFSTKKALRDVMAHEDYINQDYRILLDGINKLYSVSLDRRIRASYQWIRKVLLRIQMVLKGSIKHLDNFERDPQNQAYTVQNQITSKAEADEEFQSTLEEISIKRRRDLTNNAQSIVEIENLRRNLMEFAEEYFCKNCDSTGNKAFQEVKPS